MMEKDFCKCDAHKEESKRPCTGVIVTEAWKSFYFSVKRVIFNEPATIVFWMDGTKTVVKCSENDVYTPEMGIALCFMKKLYNNTGKFNDVLNKWSKKYWDDLNAEECASSLEEVYNNLGKILIEGFEKGFESSNKQEKDAKTLTRISIAIDSIFAIHDGDSDVDKAFRNTARYIQNAIDGIEPEYEKIGEDNGKTVSQECDEVNRADEGRNSTGADVPK